MKDLDRRLAALGRVEIDRDLGGLEDAVWAKLDARARLRPMPKPVAAMLCGAIALMASAAGAGAAVASADTSSSAPFAIHASLAPSTILAD